MKKLPPDPDGQNHDRSYWAETALIAFRKVTRTDPEDAVADLLCDLMHYCDRYDLNFEDELKRALGNYEEETFSE